MEALGQFLPLILIFVVFYFFIIRPQQKRVKEHSSMLDNLIKGDEIATVGGLLGKIKKVSDSFVVVDIAENTEVLIQKQQIAQLMPKGTIKSEQ